MTQRREIKQRSPAVWARVKQAYLAGEPAASVARRFDVGYGNLRYRAYAEGWTRKAALMSADEEAAAEVARLAGEADRPAKAAPAAQSVAPIGPREARQKAVAHAADLMGRGHGTEAMALLRAAEMLERLGADSAADASPCEDEASEAERVRAQVDQFIQDRANTLALDLLMDRGPPQAEYSAFAFRWRAMVLGPEVALADFAAGVHGGWASRYWDAEGRLIPQDPVPPMPDMMMVRQHLRHCQKSGWKQEDLSGWIWPPRDWWPEDQRPGVDDQGAEPQAETADEDAGPKIWRL